MNKKHYRKHFETVGKMCAPVILFLCCAVPASAQSFSATMVPPDSSFVMKVSREKNEVFVTLAFTPACNFASVAVERKPDFDQSFGKCLYFEYPEVVKNGRLIIKKDNYPYPPQLNVFYRIKLVTADGSERTYSPVLLQGIK